MMYILKRFIAYYKPYKKIFFIDLFCAAVISLIDLAFPQILRYLNATLFVDSKQVIYQSLGYLSVGLLMMYFIRACCRYYVSAQGHIMGAYMERDMRQDLFQHYEKLSFSYYDKHNTGTMMAKLVSDLFDICEFAHHGPENLFISLLKIVGSFTCLYFIHAPLATCLLIITCIMILFSYRKNRKMHATFLDNRKKIANVNSTLQDTLAGIRVVQSYTNEEIENEKFKKSNDMFLKSKIHNYTVMGSFYSGNNFFQGLLYITTLVVGGYYVAEGSLEPVMLATFALYINIFVSPIEILVEFAEMFQKGFSGFQRFIEVMDIEPEIVDQANAKAYTNIKGEVSYENVNFAYQEGNRPVLKNITFHIPAGKSIAFVGPSGGGKTTICSLLPRFYDVLDGCVKIDGINIKDMTIRSLRESIGIVQQDVYLFQGTIKDNIAYGNPKASFEEIIEAAKKANIHEFIMSLEDQYESLVGERGSRLSGGQKQRISIARLFLKNPKILILDEATSALDNESERYIQKSLEKLSENRTTITIAHRLSTIKNADEIIVIQDGMIKEKGTHENLLKENGVYANYYNLQFKHQEIEE